MRALISELTELLLEWDWLETERCKTGHVAKTAFRGRADWKCALCGARKNQPRDVIAAHILPLAEAGKTEKKNLIPLCHGGSISVAVGHALKKFSSTPSQMEAMKSKATSLGSALNAAESNAEQTIGCHQLLDSGLISRREIRQVRDALQNWGQHAGRRRQCFKTPLSQLDVEFNPGVGRNSLYSTAKNRLESACIQDKKWVANVGILMTLARRSFNRRIFPVAERYGGILEAFLERTESQNADIRRDKAYYELALLVMIQLPQPNLTKAIQLLQQSCDEAKRLGDLKSWSMSRLEWVHARIFAADYMADEEYKELVREQDEAIRQLGLGEGQSDAHISRWFMNYLMHRTQLHLKAGKIEQASQSGREAWSFRETLNVTTGWRQFQAVHLNTIDGVIRAWQGEYEESLRFLARAARVMRAARGKRPEGYKDVANCAAWVLAQMGKTAAAAKADRISREMVDGRSGFWRSPPSGFSECPARSLGS